MSESASKPLCILLPGTDGTGLFYADLMANLAPYADIQCLAYPQDKALSYAQLRDYLLPALPADRPYILIAESFAGPLAILIADAAPLKPAKLILAASFTANPWLILGNFARIALALVVRLTPPQRLIEYLLLSPSLKPLSSEIRSVIQTLDAKILKSRLSAALSCNVGATLRSIDVPILYLRGRKDRLIPRYCGDEIKKLGRKVSITETDAPHFILQHNVKDLVQSTLLPFIENG